VTEKARTKTANSNNFFISFPPQFQFRFLDFSVTYCFQSTHSTFGELTGMSPLPPPFFSQRFISLQSPDLKTEASLPLLRHPPRPFL
jgi:hypothetical protein